VLRAVTSRRLLADKKEADPKRAPPSSLGSVLAVDAVRLILRRIRPVYSFAGDIHPMVKSTAAVTRLWDVDADARWVARIRALTALGQLYIAP
jgi:hypothetical protein